MRSVVETKEYESLVLQNISISRQDWDAHETSWDFLRNELLNMNGEVMMANLDYMGEQHFKKTGEHICTGPAAPCPDSIECTRTVPSTDYSPLRREPSSALPTCTA